MIRRVLLAASVLVAPALAQGDPLRDPREVHLANIRQLTFGGENAEGYWSADGKKIIFQSKRDGMECDQIFEMDRDGGNVRRLSNGKGRTTCSYYFPDGKKILYASTFLAGDACPPNPDYSKGYVWKLYPSYEIFTANADGSGIKRITNNPGYDAEATLSPDGKTIIFTSLRNGDLDLYTMRPDGSHVKQITHELGYDGGAFFSRDGKRIVWRASRPKTDAEIKAYRELIAESQIRPMTLELYVADADGTHAHQVTHNGAANFGPYFFPDGKRIIYASNVADPAGRNFDLWMINDDGTGAQQITFNETFDGFPMFSPDGKSLVFASNRNDKIKGETNLFIADWVE
jgi:Tol biopolymer transport system component